MASNGQKIIENKKIQEAAAREMRIALEADERIKRIAQFEVSTTKKIEKRMSVDRFNQLKGQRNAGVLDRRRRLADIYNQEMMSWKNEVMTKVETVEERKQRIMEKAYKLRDRREAERQKYIEQCYDRQWRESVDDARTLDSQAMSKWVGSERKKMIEQNIENRAQAKAEEDEWIRTWKEQLANAGGKEDDKAAYRLAMEKATQDGLFEQMRNNYEYKSELARVKQMEDEAEIAKIKAGIAEDNAKDAKRVQDAIDLGTEVKAYNMANQGTAAMNAAIEKEQDAILLAYALHKENQAKAAEQAKKDAAKNAAKAYQKYLEDQMVKEAQDNTFADAARQAEAEKVWKARDDALQAREDARNYLMKMVKEGRQEQIIAKQERLRKEKEDEYEYSKGFIDDAKEGIRLEREASQTRRIKAEANNVKLMEQIERKRAADEKEKQDEYLANMQMKHIERMHQEKLTSQAGRLRLHFNRTKGGLDG